MNLAEKFIANWKQYLEQLSSVNCHLLLAVSGGIDSIVLTDLAFKAGFNFSIAHCNFQLRGEESKQDELFVKSIAEKYQKKFFVKEFDTEKYAAQTKISIQEAARDLRYQWFGEIVVSHELSAMSNVPTSNYLVTAHHADDNIETFLINLFRGTGLQGLKGIQLFDKQRKIRPPAIAYKKRRNYSLCQRK